MDDWIGWDGLGVCITYFFDAWSDLSAGLPGQGHGWVCELLPLFRQYKGTKFTKFIQYSRIHRLSKTICCHHINTVLCFKKLHFKIHRIVAWFPYKYSECMNNSYQLLRAKGCNKKVPNAQVCDPTPGSGPPTSQSLVAWTNHEDRILGNFAPSPFVDTFTK